MSEPSLKLIPKFEDYMQYIIELIIKLPRTEKFNIGNEYKKLMYETLENILYIEKIDKYKRLHYLNLIDSKLNTQRILLRVMDKNRWIDKKKFEVAMSKIYEIGKLLGGLINTMAKTIRNKYYEKLTYESLLDAHIKSRKGKTSKEEIILFNLKQEEYIMWLLEKLKNKTYRHGSYKIFYIKEPKVRKIERSLYIDRILHRWYVDNFLQEYFEKQFINTSFACIKNRGTHKACIAVQKGMQHCKRIWGEYYILKMDIAKFFQNIDKDILLKLLEAKIKDKDLMWLTKEIVYSSESKKSLPIGNYTSQIFANIYLNEVDQYIKHKLKVKYYYRYMDDSIVLIKTKEEAKEILENIKKFLQDNLELKLNNKTQIFKSKQGVNFCGYKINEYRMKIRDRGKQKLKKKIKYLKQEIKQGNMTNKEAKKYLAGHMGYLKIANVKNLTDKLFYKK